MACTPGPRSVACREPGRPLSPDGSGLCPGDNAAHCCAPARAAAAGATSGAPRAAPACAPRRGGAASACGPRPAGAGTLTGGHGRLSRPGGTPCGLVGPRRKARPVCPGCGRRCTSSAGHWTAGSLRARRRPVPALPRSPGRAGDRGGRVGASRLLRCAPRPSALHAMHPPLCGTASMRPKDGKGWTIVDSPLPAAGSGRATGGAKHRGVEAPNEGSWCACGTCVALSACSGPCPRRDHCASASAATP